MTKQTTNNDANLGFEAELFRAADKLRGNMEPSDYKHVALGLICYSDRRFDADRRANLLNSLDSRGQISASNNILLGEAARELLDGLAETASREWVFPGEDVDGPLGENDLYWFWRRARDAAGIVADARLHDLRHTHASHAVMNGESLHVAGRLLGYRRATTTNRYVHLDDATQSQAAERVAVVSQEKLCPTQP